jgi:hypothetical protein
MIEVITGLPGFGKTLTATNWAYNKYIRKGKKVYSNYPLKGAEYYCDILEVLGKVKNCLIVVDEISIALDALKLYQIPEQVWYELRQHRKDGVNIIGTAQSMADIAYPVRKLIQFEWNIYFKALGLVAVTCRNPQKGGDNYGKRLWMLNPHIYKLYDTYHKTTDNLALQEATGFKSPFYDLQQESMIRNSYKINRLGD